MEDGAEEAKSRGGAMPAMEDHGKTAHNASANAWRVTEHNTADVNAVTAAEQQSIDNWE